MVAKRPSGGCVDAIVVAKKGWLLCDDVIREQPDEKHTFLVAFRKRGRFSWKSVSFEQKKLIN